ncbi:tRNA 2-thiouridine(34) synthase MnmA [Dethiobacter alkaliphilus]|uniref:tRNA-specific 2-thiouridylase MnmA n=1 Tax=Dethiobacter alkaliphilus AHT 1 TaxID=555088 RepID=C0GDM4_DETAL|nr:tRNA 2-thiouridine(34) synthase MnmA [Dethiobacter alkaliphilus]EEG78507.1 tRNA (5-methylaminomethyl-2-thiouridylate)-methyltransferase [Dethiobacter alkaliphilus AHT 1]
MKKNNRVLVAMSGGVDSSLCAALLKEQGYEAIGVTMRLWVSPDFEDEAKHSGRGCCSLSAVDDARRVADKMEMPFYVLNFKESFRTQVVDYFVDEYRRGRTPNPCIACNRYLKFDLLLKKAFELEAWYVATGHYARVEYDESLERFRLKKAADARKDQTYTLYNLTQKQLAHTLFPLGGFLKSEVREMAAKYGLAVADKPDSQEICFIPDDDYKRFLREETDVESKPGPILDLDGNRLGTHQGLVNYTVGQRKGLGIAVGRPIFVVELDVENNTLIVGDDRDVFFRALVADDLNFILIDELKEPRRVMAKIRYHAKEVPALLSPLPHGQAKLEFDEPERAVTPGQSVVFYEGDDVVGGGIIQQAIR